MSVQIERPENVSPLPNETDVHLSVFVHGVRMDFAACLTAALTFVQEHRVRHYVDAVNVLPGDTAGLPRLPNERLYLEPNAIGQDRQGASRRCGG